MTGVEALRAIRQAQAAGALHGYDGFRLDTGPGKDGRLVYTVALIGYRRRQDGTIGRRRALPRYFGPERFPETAIVDAGEWVRRVYPEAFPAETQEAAR